MDMMRTIYNLKPNEIDQFIRKRISELHNEERKIVGVNSNNYIFSGFFDENVRINVSGKVEPKKGRTELLLAGLCVNDFDIYRYLVSACRYVSNPYLAVSLALNEYLHLNDPVREQHYDELDYIRTTKVFIPFLGKNETIPIRLFHKRPIGLCSEISAVAQNMFRFLDIESDFVSGMQEIPHAFNIIYPRGRKRDAILYDGTHRVNSDPLFLYLTSENKTKLYLGEEVTLTEKDNTRGTKYLFDMRLKNFDPFQMTYRIFNTDLVDGDNFKATFTNNEGKLVFKNYYKERK